MLKSFGIGVLGETINPLPPGSGVDIVTTPIPFDRDAPHQSRPLHPVDQGSDIGPVYIHEPTEFNLSDFSMLSV